MVTNDTEASRDSFSLCRIDLSPPIPAEKHLGALELSQVFLEELLNCFQNVAELLAGTVQACGIHQDSRHYQTRISCLVAAFVHVAELHKGETEGPFHTE
jgi:hypothetical protein